MEGGGEEEDEAAAGEPGAARPPPPEDGPAADRGRGQDAGRTGRRRRSASDGTTQECSQARSLQSFFHFYLRRSCQVNELLFGITRRVQIFSLN